MKKVLKTIFLLSISLFSAQNYRFVYEYKMKPDITKKDSVVTDYMNLDSDGKKSYFYNAVKYERDSVYRLDRNYSALLKNKSYDRNLNYTIEKEYSGKKLNLYDNFKGINLVIEDHDIPKWKVQKEFIEINGMNCQKAIADYRGRKWQAWFSKDYPISDGPYKFSGLPGLVVKVNDIENNHSFSLIQVKKIKSMFDLLPKSSKKMKDGEYKKLIAGYTFGPDDIESLNMDSKAGTMGIQLKDGYITRFNMNELKKSGKGNIDAEMAKRLMKSNNPIEQN
ncbi:GLPGLI family protein [Chryseobacterium sp. MEBOG06]|uniref:GLPGLI family protein n=1 Tax=Chryseobacterium sp. MEBOG06 TaxID=2879938 RepID=UPI001F34B935|nr:GLPGLI family protein [Chryseobacterium sp. MEBOG06]UKB85858.1 GLPGLI family protein [Chryseobacterium sp. MEBOG06]